MGRLRDPRRVSMGTRRLLGRPTLIAVVLVGLAAGGAAVVLYSVATVLQAVAARRVAGRSPRGPTLAELLAQPQWLLGVALLGCAFLAFVLSARELPLPLAEAIRGSYVVFTVLLGHVVFRTRPRRSELVGVLLALVGLVLFVAPGGARGDTEPGSATAVAMAVVLAGVACASVVVARTSVLRPPALGAVEAALSGVAFATLDMGVRSLPEPFSVTSALTCPACWIGAAAAPTGLLLFSRAVSRTSVGVATTVMVVVNVVSASLWAALAFQDRVDAGIALLLVSGGLMVGGSVLVMAASPQGVATITELGPR